MENGTEKATEKITAVQLAEKESISISAVSKRWKKVWGNTVPFDRFRELDETEASALRKGGDVQRVRTAARKANPLPELRKRNQLEFRDELVEQWKERAEKLGLELAMEQAVADEIQIRLDREILRNEELQIRLETKPSNPAGFIKSDGFLQVALLLCLFTQMVHTGGFFWHQSPVEQPFIRAFLSITFAVAVDFTAILLTVRSGKEWYLWAFMVFHLTMNLTFHDSVGHEVGFGVMLLSAALAISTLAYSELFITEKVDNQ